MGGPGRSTHMCLITFDEAHCTSGMQLFSVLLQYFACSCLLLSGGASHVMRGVICATGGMSSSVAPQMYNFDSQASTTQQAVLRVIHFN